MHQSEAADVSAVDEVADRAVHSERVALRREGSEGCEGSSTRRGVRCTSRVAAAHRRPGSPLRSAVRVGLPHVEHRASAGGAVETADGTHDVRRTLSMTDAAEPAGHVAAELVIR